MENCLCWLWVIPLAAAIPCLVAWLSSFIGGVDDSELEQRRDPMPWIHGLTPRCRAALDRCTDEHHARCSEPQRLLSMSVEALQAKLDAANWQGEARPPKAIYETWPYQAGLLADGEYEVLREWQRARWPEDFAPPPALRSHSRRREHKPRRWGWFLASVSLLFLSLVLVGRYPCPSRPTAGILRLELTADMFFPYNKFAPYSEAHTKALRQQLSDFFAQYQGVRITRIEAHTDPIGGVEENNQLGLARAGTVLNLIRELQAADEGHEHFAAEPLPLAPARAGPNLEDIEIWRWCFGNLYQSVAKSELRPLTDLDSDIDRSTIRCSQTPNPPSDKGYPACANPYSRAQPLKVFFEQAEKFREITECLAPMRHVIVYGTYQALAPIAAHP